MKPAGRAAAAIAILDAITTRHQPAAQALRDWGRAHRFAGARDRAAIGDLVHEALRRSASLAWRMGDDTPRALILALLAFVRNAPLADIAAMGSEPYGFGPLSEAEKQALSSPRPLDDAPVWVRGDFPQWLQPQFLDAFGDAATAHGQALARRAPVDVRANALKGDRGKARRALARFHPVETPYSPLGLRFAPGADGRLPNVTADAAHGRGLIEVQDEGSQIAALLCAARPGEQVLDLCAGAGGKTLALAAQMQNRGQIHAHDADKHRQRPIFERIRRAGIRNAQIIAPHQTDKLDALRGRMDLVLVDAPCSGSGTWRRKPDAKWRLSKATLDARTKVQRDLLRQAADFVKPGGRLVYVTCSVLPVENDAQVKAFLKEQKAFSLLNWQDQAAALASHPRMAHDSKTLQMTPLEHETDGFFIAIMQRMP